MTRLPERLFAGVKFPDPRDRLSLFLVGVPLTRLPCSLVTSAFLDALDLRGTALDAAQKAKLAGPSEDRVWELRLTEA